MSGSREIKTKAHAKESQTLRSADYVHLHNHTEYSLLDGLTKIPELVGYVKTAGMEAVAITDHGTMSGAIEFYKATKAAGLKPIVGMEAYISPRGHTDKDPARDRQYYHLTILAMNNQGYQNLMRLSSIANLYGFYYKPRIDHQLLEKYNEGLIILSGCMGGEVSDALRQGQYPQAKKTATWYKKIFGDRYYIELQDHGHPSHPTVWAEQTVVNNQLLKMAKELNLPAVVTCDAHYLRRQDQEAHEILLCVQTGAYLSDEQRMSLKDFELYVASPLDIIDRWGAKHPELITNSKKIADRCELDIELGKILIPQFSTPNNETERSFLRKKVWRGLAWRYGGKTRQQTAGLPIAEAKKSLPRAVVERAEYELGVIDRMGFNGYFLIVADFINWGKEQGIVFGPGRGSAASSIIAYATRITEIDPLAYDLLFERFLNPDRISMPDIDIDIQDDRRNEVINYCINKYGKDRVANIVTFGRMAARNSVRDVARVLQVPYSEADRLAKMIPPPTQGRHIPLATQLREVPELKVENATNPGSARVFELATRLEGTIRSHGVHAAGVVIAPGEIVKYAPLELAQKGVVATQYSMGPIEDLGLLKMDFLGLSNLTIIKNTLRIVKRVYDQDLDINQIPLDDAKTFKLLQNGDTTGVFQLESAGMKRYIKQLKPTEFEDIIAMVALYRPGPIQWIDDFIARKSGRKKIEYLHPVMKETLESTYGVIVYQEQFMQISKDLCGFSSGQADTLRKGIGKKIPEVLAKLKNDFIEGAIKHSGVERKMMEKFWLQLMDFAAYCFNKVHSACYGLIAYQTAYLKAHYPEAFMAALMTSDYDDTDRLAIEINECKQLGIEVLAPDVNESFHEFAVVPAGQQIRFGLDAIKNVGHGAAEEVLRAREASGGKFKNIEDYCTFVSPQIVNRKSLESLIKAGALDRFGERGVLMHNIENILAFSSRLQKDAASGQVGLFGTAADDLDADVLKFTWSSPAAQLLPSEQLAWERELLGLYLSSHPLEAYEAFLLSQTIPLKSITSDMEGKEMTIGGSITGMREITTKNGAKMAFVRLADTTGEIELVVFPKLYGKDSAIWQRDQIVITKGKLGGDRGRGDGQEIKLLADEARVITDQDVANHAARKKPAAAGAAVDKVPNSTQPARQRLYIRLEDSSNEPVLLALKEKLDIYQGETEVVLVTGAEAGKQAIRLPQTISVNEESLRDLASVFGAMNVVVR